MAGFLIDENLPYRFGLWASDEYTHVNVWMGSKQIRRFGVMRVSTI